MRRRVRLLRRLDRQSSLEVGDACVDGAHAGVEFPHLGHMDEASGGARGALAPPTATDSVELIVFFF